MKNLFKEVIPFPLIIPVDDKFTLDVATVADGKTYAQVSHPECKGDDLALEFLHSQKRGVWLKPLEWTYFIDSKKIVKSNPCYSYERGVWQWLFVKG